MSKEIDFSKAPEGATHYYQESEDDHFAWAKYVGDAIYIFVQLFSSSCWTLYSGFGGDHPIKIPTSWSIYTNDKPICDLSYEQRCKLFNAWVKGEVRQIFKGGKFIDMAIDECNWHVVDVYRIKPKSERELFVEACLESISSKNSDDPAYYDDWFEQLFDSGKFKLVEQPK